MSLINGVYTNPGWANDGPPALSADNLNDISNAIVENQDQISDIHDDISTIQTSMASPFIYKGVVADLTALEAVANPQLNWTYYVTSESCLYSYNGEDWYQASMKESAYLAQIAGLNSDLNKVTALMTINGIQNNLFNKDTVTNGYMSSDGVIHSSPDTYCHSVKIPVEAGKTYSFWLLSDGDATSSTARFICAYDSNDSVVSASGVDDYVSSYTVPSGIASIVITVAKANKDLFVMVEGTTAPTTYYTATADFIQDAYEELGGGSGDIDEVTALMEHVEGQGNLFNKETVTDGYMSPDGSVRTSPDTYCHSVKIPVEVGKTYSFWLFSSGAVISSTARFVCAYDSNNSVVSASGADDYVSTYTVPSGIASIVITVAKTNKDLFMMVEGTTAPTTFVPYGASSYYIATANFIRDAYMELQGGSGSESESIAVSRDSSVAGTTYQIVAHLDNKKNCAYTFFGKFTSFTSLEIGHGKTDYAGYYMVIDGTNLTTYNNSGTVQTQVAHNLSISDFISVSIKVADTAAASSTVTIITNGDSATLTNVEFLGCNGSVYYLCGQTTTDVEFVYTIMDMRKDVYVFGDSYISLFDERWTFQAINNNDNNFLLCGFGGADSSEELPSFETVLSMKNPKYVCWFLGMNDGDTSGTVNASWLAAVNSVLTTCDQKGITPILATIPNCPVVRNVEKNNWVKASGRRYVDFARAVGAEEAGSTWYTGMLSSDNVHPTVEGAKALWLRARLDLPEIMQSNPS